MTNFEKVQEFARKFHLPSSPEPTCRISDELFLFRLNLILEEVTEIMVARQGGDTVKLADGIADLLYVTYGLACACGIPIDQVFAAVHEANMKKVRSTGAADPLGRRGSGHDVVKPADWSAPDVQGVLFP